MSIIQREIDEMLEILPDEEQRLALELIKRIVLAWDPDFTKVTEQERKDIEHAKQSGFVSEDEIDWDDLSKYA